MNRRGGIIWFALDTQGDKRIHVNYPIACSVFRELLDSILDLTTLLCFFVPEKPSAASNPLQTGRELSLLLMTFFGAVTENGPYDMVDVSTDHIKLRVSIKNKLNRIEIT